MCWEPERRPLVYTRPDLPWVRSVYSKSSWNYILGAANMWQYVRCGWTTKWEKKVDSLLRECHIDHFLCGLVWVWSGSLRREQSSESLTRYKMSSSNKRQNRMMESLVLFDSVVNSRWFTRTSIILFLNKVDLFRQKLGRSPLSNYFPDYSGGNDINRASKYLLWRFNQVNRAHLNLYPQYVSSIPDSAYCH